MEEKNKTRENKIIELLEKQNTHLSRLSNNVQFFFWFFIISMFLSIGLSILGAASFFS